MAGVDPFLNNMFLQQAAAADKLNKLFKKEAKKGDSSKLYKAMRNYNVAHKEFKKAMAESLSEELGKEVGAGSKLVDSAVFSVSLSKIFENRDGEEALDSDLKRTLQNYDSESLEAKRAVASKLSEGSQQKVSENDQLVDRDIDFIAIKSLENPDLLF